MLTFLQIQADSLAIAAQDIAETTNSQNEISALGFILKGGVFMIPIILLFIYTIYLMIERYLYIRKATRGNKNDFNQVIDQLNNGKLDTALAITQRDSNATLKVVEEGVLSIGRPIGEIEGNMERKASIEVGQMERKLSHLGLIAGIAPTLGFVGTILGVIKIFYNISISENVSIGNISGGLYEKMISSGSGLIVGIIAYAAYHILNSMIDNFTLKTQVNILEFINTIQRPNGNQKK
ncbi:MotA/TolQ/ExbB proton channel family protein [Myroides injenensis]|uniref:MotA/TolQ/ExbB proton channel family protein n=1 Tax=Myroides injenensis TaxID=1183151 RepID=UPI0022721BFB|nr:MotA/TolQ/ExbB proton channel family protein [Myroides injenensis]